MKLGYIEQASLLMPLHAEMVGVQRVLVRCWELHAEDCFAAYRLPGPPLLTVEDYHAPAGDRQRLKLVTVQGPAELLGG